MKNYRITFVILFLAFFVYSVSNVYAANDANINEMKKELESLKSRIAELEKKLEQQQVCVSAQEQKVVDHEQKIQTLSQNFEASQEYLMNDPNWKPVLSKDGFRIGVIGTFIGQGTNNANIYGSDKRGKFGGSSQLNIEMEKAFHTIDGRAYVNTRLGEGTGVDDQMILYSAVDNNKVNDKHLWITSFFYEQYLFAKKFIFNLGKIDSTMFFDYNRLAGDDSKKFLASIFNNNPVIEFPDQNLGIRLGIMPIESIEITYLALNSNKQWQNIDNQLFNIGQFTIKPKLFGREGYYRFMAWYNNSDHINWKTGDRSGTYGFALSFDQDVSDEISLFARYGWEDPDVYNPSITATKNNIISLNQSWSTGIQLIGRWWGREKDLVGFAIGQVIPSEEYKKMMKRHAKDEGHLEIYYDIFFNEHICVTPDFQYVLNPYGGDAEDNNDPAFIYAFRARIDF